MGYYEFPHTRNYDTDLGYLIKQYLNLREEVDYLIDSQTIVYADPLQWSIDKQYKVNTIVIDGYNAYLSKKPIPLGIEISNTDYWLVVGDFIQEFDDIRNNIANANAGVSPTTTKELNNGDLVWWHDTLYKCITNMTIGTAFVADSNIVKITIEDYIDTKFENSKIIANVKDYGAKGDGITDDTNAIKAAINSENSIFFPPGTYKITNTINLKEHLSLIGAGKETTFIKYDETTTIDSLFNTSATTPMINIKDLSIVANANVNKVLNLNTTYSRIENIKVSNGVTSIYLTGWCDTLKDLQLFDSTTPLSINTSNAITCINVQSNAGSFIAENSFGSLVGCAFDNGNPSYKFITSYFDLSGCDCETYHMPFQLTASNVSINSGRFEEHISGIVPTTFMEMTNSIATLNAIRIYYDDYESGTPTTLGITLNNSKLKGTYTCNVDTPWYVTNSSIECNGEALSDISGYYNKKIINATASQDIKIEVPYRKPINVKFNVLVQSYDNTWLISGNALLMNGGEINVNNITITGTTESNKPSVIITSSDYHTANININCPDIQNMTGSIEY